MRNLVTCLLLVMLVPAGAPGQEKTKQKDGQGYAFVGLGAINAEAGTLQFGGGAEANLYKGLGIGLEIGYFSPMEAFGDGIGIFSVNGQYIFGLENPRRFKPFVTGGYSLAFRSSTANAMNFGGGIHYWLSNRLGLRLEIRDYIIPDIWDMHAWQGRVGLEFR